MSTAKLRDEVPTWPTIGVALIILISLPYTILIQGTLTGGLFQWASIWSGVLGIALSLFLVYLFYRLVVAVEKIADKL